MYNVNLKNEMTKLLLRARLEEVKTLNIEETLGAIHGACSIALMPDEEYNAILSKGLIPPALAEEIDKADNRMEAISEHVVTISRSIVERKILKERFNNDVDKMIDDFQDHTSIGDLRDEFNNIVNKDGE